MSDQKEYRYEALEDPLQISAGLHQEPAGRGQRFGASFIDGIISSALTFPLTFLVTGEWVKKTSPSDSTILGGILNSTGGFGLTDIGLALGSLALFIAVQSWFILTRSQTIGKMAFGIVINVNDQHKRAGFGQIVLKRMLLMNLIAYIPLMGTVFSFVDIFFIFSPSRRCLHDRIANTHVVKA